MKSRLLNLMGKIPINKWVVGFIVLVLCLIIIFYVFIRIRTTYKLTEQVSYHLQNRLIEAGVPPRIPIEEEVVRQLERLLPEAFPNKDLRVVRDGNIYKIYGDLSLGRL